MTVHIGTYDNEPDYILNAKAASVLKKFVLGTHFHDILAALDTDTERVKKRVAVRKDISDLKAHRRDSGLREMVRWLGTEDEFKSEDYSHMPTPKIPIPYPL